MHGIASRPKPKPKTPAAPAAKGPPQPHLPNPRDAFAKALEAIRPTLDTQGRVWCMCSSDDLGKRSSVDLDKPPPPSLECCYTVARRVA